MTPQDGGEIQCLSGVVVCLAERSGRGALSISLPACLDEPLIASAFVLSLQGTSELCWNASETVCYPYTIVPYCFLFQYLGAVSYYFCPEGLFLPNK